MEHIPTEARGGAAGTTSMVLGIIALVLSFIPLVGILAWPLLLLAAIFGVVGLVRTRGSPAPKGRAITGVSCAGAALVVCVVWIGVLATMPAPDVWGGASPGSPVPGLAERGNTRVPFGKETEMRGYRLAVSNPRVGEPSPLTPDRPVWLVDVTATNTTAGTVNPAELQINASVGGRSAPEAIGAADAQTVLAVGEIPPGRTLTWTMAFEGAGSARAVMVSRALDGATTTWTDQP